MTRPRCLWITNAPLGTSETFLQQSLDNLNPEEMIEELQVNCFNLAHLLDKIGFNKNIDVLQIDTEGLDDNIIFNSAIESTQPQIIHFEHAHLSEERMVKLIQHLYQHNYRVSKHGTDTLAIRKRPRILDLMLRVSW